MFLLFLFLQKRTEVVKLSAGPRGIQINGVQVVCMCVSLCILGLGTRGRTRPKRKSGEFTDPSATASHCQDSDLQCGHRSPGELIDVTAFPWGLADVIHQKLEFGKVSALHTQSPEPEVGGTWIFPPSDSQPVFSPSQAAALPFRSPNPSSSCAPYLRR